MSMDGRDAGGDREQRTVRSRRRDAGADHSRRERTIRLDDFLKCLGIVPTGGRAKQLIQGGGVVVNGEVETRRGRRIRPGDRVEALGGLHVVEESVWKRG